MVYAQETMTGEIIVDNFAGGGGASTGIEIATGRVVALAVNHDPAAILMHRTNHPYTEHFQASVWDIDPKAVCRGRPVGLAWFSPDCRCAGSCASRYNRLPSEKVRSDAARKAYRKKMQKEGKRDG